MRHSARAFAAILLATLAPPAWASPAGRVPPSADADAASRAFDDAQFRGDIPALERFLALGFVYVSGSGRVAGRREFIANFSDPTQRFDPFVITDRRVIALGRDAVVVAADGIISGTAGGRPFREHFRFADTFVRHGRGWRVAYVQVTPVGA